MHIREFMSTNVKVCIPESSCAKAGGIMRRHQRGFLLIVDSLKHRRVVGMLTDRDIMLYLIHLDLPASEATVRACMTAPPTMISYFANPLQDEADQSYPYVKGSARTRWLGYLGAQAKTSSVVFEIVTSSDSTIRFCLWSKAAHEAPPPHQKDHHQSEPPISNTNLRTCDRRKSHTSFG